VIDKHIFNGLKKTLECLKTHGLKQRARAQPKRISLGKSPAPMGLTLGRAQSHGLNYILNLTLLISLGV